MIIHDSKSDKVLMAVNTFLLTLFLLVIIYPIYLVVISSFSDPTLVATGKVWFVPKGVTLEAYRRVLMDDEIMIGYRNTIFYTVFGTLINLILTVPAAYALSKQRLHGKRLFLLLIVFTMYFSGGTIPTYITVKNLKLLNTWWVLLLTGGVTTYNLIIARTFLQNGVPKELEDAAQIDGCSTFRLFVSIILPLSKAMLGVITLYYAVAHWNSYFSALIYLMGAREKVPLQLILREILITNIQNAKMMEDSSDEMVLFYSNLANLIKYAVIIIAAAPLLIVYPFIQKYFDKGVMLGSLKG